MFGHLTEWQPASACVTENENKKLRLCVEVLLKIEGGGVNPLFASSGICGDAHATELRPNINVATDAIGTAYPYYQNNYYSLY